MADRIFGAYMSLGSVTERLFFVVAPYTPTDRVSVGYAMPGSGRLSTWSSLLWSKR